MSRAHAALAVCAARIRKQGVTRIEAVATQACRVAANGHAFIAEVERQTGLRLEIITPREEAQLSVAGCLNLLDRNACAALVLDVGGGSTELSWIDLASPGFDRAARRSLHRQIPITAWLSAPIGVVTLAERFPEPANGGLSWFRSMVEAMKDAVAPFSGADCLRAAFAAGRAHLVGTSRRDHQPCGHAPGPGALQPRTGRRFMDEPRGVRNGGGSTGQPVSSPARHPAVHRPGPRRSRACRGGDPAGGPWEVWPCERVPSGRSRLRGESMLHGAASPTTPAAIAIGVIGRPRRPISA